MSSSINVVIAKNQVRTIVTPNSPFTDTDPAIFIKTIPTMATTGSGASSMSELTDVRTTINSVSGSVPVYSAATDTYSVRPLELEELGDGDTLDGGQF